MAGNRTSGTRKVKAVDQGVLVAYNRTEIEEIFLGWNEDVLGSNVGKDVLPEAVDEGTCFHEYNSII